MSRYCRMEGQLFFNNEESFNQCVQTLKMGHWLNDKDQFIDETGFPITEDANVDHRHLVIAIPHFTYRNLCNINFFLPGTKGQVIGTTTDGDFTGWAQTEKCTQTFPLDLWAEEHVDDEMPDVETDFDAYVEWQCEVENYFFDYYKK